MKNCKIQGVYSRGVYFCIGVYSTFQHSYPKDEYCNSIGILNLRLIFLFNFIRLNSTVITDIFFNFVRLNSGNCL